MPQDLERYELRNGVLVLAFPIHIDFSKAIVLEDHKRYKVLTNKDHTYFCILVGFDEEHRQVIFCHNMGELIHALALVRTAFPAKCKS